MRLAGHAPAGQWIKATNDAEKAMAKATTLAMRQVGKLAVSTGRERITNAGFSDAFARTLVAINQPRTGYVLNPSVYIHSTINYADVFERGATIHGDPYLWLPLPNVPSFKGRPHMTPKQYVQNVGPLVTMRRPGKTPLLGAPVAGTVRPGRRIGRKRLIRGATASRAEVTIVPMFVGVTSVTIPKKFDTKAAADEAFDHLQDFYDDNIRPDEDMT